MGFLIERELEYLDGKLENPEAPLPRDHGRREGIRQNPGHHQPSWKRPTPSSSAARWQTPSARRRATRPATAASKPTSSTSRSSILAKAEAKGVRFPAPRRHPRHAGVQGRRGNRSHRHLRTGRRTPDGWEGIDIGDVAIDGIRTRKSRRRKPSSGTARWACSKSTASPTAPRRSPRPWPRAMPSPSSAAAIP